MPLNLARIYEEDIMSDEEVKAARVEMKMQGVSLDSSMNES